MPYRRLTQLLDSRFEELSAELQKAARWARQHPAELGLQSLRQSAASAGVSPATMSRLARALGLSGFEEMRRPSMQAVAQTLGRDVAGIAPGTAHTGSLNSLSQCQSANTASVYQRNSQAAMDSAADLIAHAQHLVFLGLRSSFSIAYNLHYTCDWLRGNASLATDAGGAWPEKVLALRPGDVLVVVSQAPYTRQVVELTQQAVRQGAAIVVLTDSELSPLARMATVSLFYNTASPSFFHSQTGALSLAEALMTCVSEHHGMAGSERLAQRQEAMQRMGAYWDRPEPSRRKRNPSTHESKH